MNVPRSDLLQRVLISLSDHPHDDTVERLVSRMGLIDPGAVDAALTVLAADGLVSSARGHWQLTRPAWALARTARGVSLDQAA